MTGYLCYAWAMVRDSAATRNRILDAAIDEFAASGLAGARIDRIAEAAEANKRSIYVYYESKEGLFTAALHRVITDLVEAVPLTEEDLPGYAGRMFDYLLDHPEALRMSMWRHLERPAAGPNVGDVYARKIEAMTRGSGGRSGLMASGLPPTDLLVLVQGLASSWLISPEDLLAADSADPYSSERLAVHRAAIVEAARRLCAPTP
ncbi:MAG: TetR family transcriptional regulator [Actinomycetota bacterium]|nr:TetR/AcrR family transcriptional regulator [Rubrobacter sp.]MBA3790103.1 TetR/AcrR family transcriptional regulator [Rubrobacter sp.]MDQ3238655.1 TetR family transcriptional regulator [Actinomycetota bacterium]